MSPQPSLFPEMEQPRPLAGCVTEPWQAWFRFQRAVANAARLARGGHRQVRPLLQRQRQIVHAALRGAR